MKRWIKILLVPVCATAIVVCLLLQPTPGVQRIGFIGFTNGTLGTMGSMFSTFFPSNAAAIQDWIAQGTNAAVFVVTNGHKFPINLFPFARVVTQQGKPALDQTPLLNAPDATGILLSGYQVATIHVAALPQTEPWKVIVTYHREVNSYSWLEDYLPSWLGGVPDQSGAPPNTFMTENRLMESDWIRR